MEVVQEPVALAMVPHHRPEDTGDLREAMEDNLELDPAHQQELMVLPQEAIPEHQWVELLTPAKDTEHLLLDHTVHLQALTPHHKLQVRSRVT